MLKYGIFFINLILVLIFWNLVLMNCKWLVVWFGEFNVVGSFVLIIINIGFIVEKFECFVYRKIV